jgi:hypothetical protein
VVYDQINTPKAAPATAIRPSAGPEKPRQLASAPPEIGFAIGPGVEIVQKIGFVLQSSATVSGPSGVTEDNVLYYAYFVKLKIRKLPNEIASTFLKLQ